MTGPVRILPELSRMNPSNRCFSPHRTAEAVSGESPLAHESPGLGRASAEFLVGRLRIAKVAGGIDIFEQPLRETRVENIARLLEGLKTVGVENLGPEIAVIGGRIAAAAEDVLKMRRPVPHRDCLRHFQPFQLPLLESDDVDARPLRVQIEVDKGG